MAALIRQVHRLARQNVIINLIGGRAMSSDKLSQKPPAKDLVPEDDDDADDTWETLLPHANSDGDPSVNAESFLRSYYATGHHVKLTDDMNDAEVAEEKEMKSTMDIALGYVAGDHRIQLREELLGTTDPFDVGVLKQPEDVGVADNPILVPTADNTRVVGCICEEDNSDVVWMMIHSGEKKTCDCGNWFLGVPIPGSRLH